MSWMPPPNLTDFLAFIAEDMQVPANALPNVMPPAAPGLTATPLGGTLPGGPVYAVVTYVTGYGETTASPEANAVVTGPNGQLIVASPPASASVTGYNFYAAATSGNEVLQNGATPIAIGTAYTLATLATGTAAPPVVNTASSPWPGYALSRALNLVPNLTATAGLDYVLAVYNCAGHILLTLTPDRKGYTYFKKARAAFDLLGPSSGVISSSSDQGTSNSFAVPDQLRNFIVGDLNFFRTPWGRFYLDFAQSIGPLAGLT